MQGNGDYFYRYSKAKRNEPTQLGCHIKETIAHLIKPPVFGILGLEGADAQHTRPSTMGVPTERELYSRLG